VGSALIERPTGVIVGPVAAENKGHDGNVDHIDIIRQINVSASIVVLQIIGGNPAAVAGPAYIAPGIASEATMNVNVGTTGNPVDHWKAAARASPETHRIRDNSPRRQRSGGHC
jgi:hypothetical protein